MKLKGAVRMVSVASQSSAQVQHLKELHAQQVKEKAVNVREIIFYAIFMALFTALSTRGLNDEVRFRHHSALKSILVGTGTANLYARVNTRDTATEWLTSVFASGLATQPFRSGEWRVVGPVRLSQLRGQKRSCGNQPEAWEHANDGAPFACFGDSRGDWDPEAENKTDFRGFRYENPNTPPIEKQRTAGFFAGYYSAHFNTILPHPGFEVLIDPYADLSCNHSKCDPTSSSAWNGREAAITAQLEEVLGGEANYFDAYTKVLWVDATVYSPGTQLATWVRLSFESGRGGSIVVFDDFQTIEPWLSKEELRFVTPLHVLVAIGYVYYFLIELLELRSHGWKRYFSSVQNWIQIVNICLYVVQWILKGIAFTERPSAHTLSLTSVATFFDFRSTTRALIAVKQVQACNVFLNWFKVSSMPRSDSSPK
jgi:hypothetical protein